MLLSGLLIDQCVQAPVYGMRYGSYHESSLTPGTCSIHITPTASESGATDSASSPGSLSTGQRSFSSQVSGSPSARDFPGPADVTPDVRALFPWKLENDDLRLCYDPDGCAVELGSGPWGPVYKGLMHGTDFVAVRKVRLE